MRNRFIPPALLLLALVAVVPLSGTAPRFYPDDPIAREPESRDASGAATLGMDLFFEYSYNLFVTGRRAPSNTRAKNLNTIDEVPDSSWFTNRVGTVAVSDEQLVRGPNSNTPPVPERWTLLKEKTAGTNPGFTARDANGETWFLQFDNPARPGGNTSDVEIATKLFWALGYNQVETFITSLDPRNVVFDPKATVKRPSGDRTAFTRDDMMLVLEKAAKNPDGTYRASAGRVVPGQIIGNFRYSGTRSDDPNDLVPHEHRRELRALRVFGAWLNFVDWKAGNTLDALVQENGRTIVKHYLQDVGSSLGMANDPGVWDMGWHFFYDGPETKRRLLSFGFNLSPMYTVPYTFYPSVGYFEGDWFDPRAWKPQTPTKAFLELRDDDAFWAARKLQAFTDDLIRTVVHVGQFGDPAAEQHLAAVLMKRRDRILQTYLPAVNPVVDPRLAADGTLTFANAAVDARVADPPSRYSARWSWFDNATGALRSIGATESATTSMQAPGDGLRGTGEFVEIDIAADSVAYPTWQQPVKTFFRRTAAGWKLVGLERMPEGPAVPAARPVETERP